MKKTTEFRELAERIATVLFTNGDGQMAGRLVLEMPRGDGGGWSRLAAADQIEKILVEASLGAKAIGKLPKELRAGDVAKQLVKSMREFIKRLDTGEPVTVTRIEREDTPDGPLTTRERKVI